MTRDELILQQLKTDARVYRVLFVVVVIAAAASVALGIFAIATDRPDGLFVFIPFALSFAGSAIPMNSRSKAAAGAVREIGDNPTDLDQYHDYSRETMSALRTAQHTTKEYLQLWVAYGICAVMMIGLGIMLLVLLWGDEPALLALAGLLAAGGVLLFVLAVESFLSWQMAKKLDSLAN